MAAMAFQPVTTTDPFGLVGQTLAGRFRIERQVAEGGFGVVYKARQLALDRDVAVKVLRMPDDLTSDEVRAFHRTFDAEALTIARLKQSAIVEVHDFGVTERANGDPLHWMALEWLEGKTLATALEEQRGQPLRGPAAALELLRPVFQAIGHAHRQRVAHCDLKPANVFLVDSPEGPVPRVLDFGIAKMMAGDGDDRLATGGFSAFSPDYAAPEQFGRARTGPWTDVHALGLLLTEVITGKPPYSEAEEARLGEIMAERRPTPGGKGVAVGSWEPVLQRALALRPSERFPDADAFLAALEQAGPPTAAVPARRLRRSPAVLVVAALAVAALVSAGSWRARRSPPAPAGLAGLTSLTLAVLPFQNLTGDPQQEYFSDGLADGTIRQLGKLAPEQLSVIARTSVSRYKGSPRSPAAIGRELGVGYVLGSTITRREGHIRVRAHLVRVDQGDEGKEIWARVFDRETRDTFGLPGDIARAAAAGLHLKLSPEQRTGLARRRSVNPEAYDAYLRARYFSSKKTPEGARQARAYFEQAIELDGEYAAAYAGLAQNFPGWEGEAGARAKVLAQRAVELDEDLPEAHSALASVLLGYDWDWPGAERHYRRALELDPNDGETHGWYARIPLSTGHFAEAIAERKRAVELSPLSLDAYSAVGAAYYMARRYDEAIAQLQGTIELDSGFWLPHLFLGCLYAHKGMYAQALAEGEKCAAFPAGCLGRVTGYTHALAGRPGAALAVVERMKTLARSEYVAAVDFARVFAGLGRRDESLAWLEKAYQERNRDLVFLRVDPQWDPLRADPRFTDLIRRVGIP